MNATTTTMLTGLLSLCLFSPAMGTDFSGKLKEVTITDAQAANKPPVATVTYSRDGQTILFDAGESTDPDGSIVKYQWDFGNGQVVEGVTASYTLVGEEPFQVTLSVIDNNNGVTLIQQTITLAEQGISDDFSSDTSADYNIMVGNNLSVYDGSLHTGIWSTVVAYNKTSLGNNDHSVSADVVYSNPNGGGILIRCDPHQKTGYVIFFESGRISLNTYNNGLIKYLAVFDGKYTDGIYNIKATIEGSLITVAVNGSIVLRKTDSTYSDGSYVGVRFRTGVDGSPISIDNFQAK